MIATSTSLCAVTRILLVVGAVGGLTSCMDQRRGEQKIRGTYVSARFGLLHVGSDTALWYNSAPLPYRFLTSNLRDEHYLTPIGPINYCGIVYESDEHRIELHSRNSDELELITPVDCLHDGPWRVGGRTVFTRINKLDSINFEWLEVSLLDSQGQGMSSRTYKLEELRDSMESDEDVCLSLNQQLWMVFESGNDYYSCGRTGHESPAYQLRLGGGGAHRCTEVRFVNVPPYIRPLIDAITPKSG